MKIKKWALIFGVSCMTIMVPVVGKAATQEVVNGKEQTPVTIQVVESPLKLAKVQAPTFDTYTFDKGTSNVQLGASRDLVIKVEDTRLEDLSSWGIQYNVSLFNDFSKGTAMDTHMKFKVGAGNLSIGNASMDESFYRAQAASLSADNSEILMQTTGSKTATFTYRVPKEKIQVTLPGELQEGEYQALQTVTLINVPVVDN